MRSFAQDLRFFQKDGIREIKAASFSESPFPRAKSVVFRMNQGIFKKESFPTRNEAVFF